MEKEKKLLITFVLALFGTLVMPIFAQWFEQQTGIYPYSFIMTWIAGIFVSVILIINKDSNL